MASTLTIVFIVLKLLGFINWSWFYVILPSIIELLLITLVVLITILRRPY